MKLSLDFKHLGIFKKLSRNLGLLMWIVLGLLGLGVGWVIYGDASKVVQLKTDADLVQNKIIRVNVEKHEAVEKQLNDNAAFVPEPVGETDAFVPPPPVKTGR